MCNLSCATLTGARQWTSSRKSNQQQSRVSCRLAGQKGNIDKGINIERMERRPTVMSESTNSERRRRNRGIGCVCALVLMSCWLSDEMPYVTAAGRVRPHASNNFKRVEEHKVEILEISDTLQDTSGRCRQGFGENQNLVVGRFGVFFVFFKDHSQDLIRKKMRPVVSAFLKWCFQNNGLYIKAAKSEWAFFPHWPSFSVLHEITRCWHHSLV